jgi:aminoglycoside phosphotransferase (APT) family kinase protein
VRYWTTRDAEAALLQAGFAQDPAELKCDTGEGRIAVRLPDDRMAWFPTNAEGERLLARERRVLRLIEQHCHFAAPRVIHEDRSGWELRKIVAGDVRPAGLQQRVERDASFARLFGGDLGRILAEQHTRIPKAALGDWLPSAPNWPRPEDLAFLPEVVQDAGLLGRIQRALERRAALRDDSPVLVHADLALHNIAVDPESQRVAGVFDYEGAVFGDRHQDFAYMVFQQSEEPMLEGALAAYEPATGVKIDRQRVHLLNAIAAIGFLGFRHGHLPEEPWCGRTLAEDLAWTEAALALAQL